MNELDDLQVGIDRLYLGYACRALRGGGKGKFVMQQLKGENPKYYKAVMKAARKHLGLLPDEVEENETPDWEEEQRNAKMYDRAYMLSRLQSKYPDEFVELILAGKIAVPLWLQKEMKEREVKKDGKTRGS